MHSPVIDILRDRLLQALKWHCDPRLAYRWGTVIHRREEQGCPRPHFGVITPTGESLPLSATLLEELRNVPCWLDGIVPVRLEARELSDVSSGPASRTDRPRLVEALAVYFDLAESPDESGSFKQMAGVLTPATMPSELFVLTSRRPESWPL